MSQQHQHDLRDIARTDTLTTTESVNQYLSLGWVLLSATAAEQQGYFTERYVLGWPTEKGEPTYPRSKSRDPDGSWADHIAKQVQPDPGLKTRGMMAAIEENLQSLVGALNDSLESESRVPIDLRVHSTDTRCILARADKTLTFFVHDQILLSAVDLVPDTLVERPEGSQPVPVAKRHPYGDFDLLNGAVYVARRFIERILGVAQLENDGLTLWDGTENKIFRRDDEFFRRDAEDPDGVDDPDPDGDPDGDPDEDLPF
jgi:hypothetical protein